MSVIFMDNIINREFITNTVCKLRELNEVADTKQELYLVSDLIDVVNKYSSRCKVVSENEKL